MPSKAFTPEIIGNDNLIEIISNLVQELSQMRFTPGCNIALVEELIDRLLSLSDAILKATITKTNAKLAQAASDLKTATKSAKDAVAHLKAVQEAIEEAALAVKILDQGLKLVGVFVP
jgi:hypothetical protein